MDIDMDALKTDLRRAVCTWQFCAGAFGLSIAAFFGVFDRLLPLFQGEYMDGLPEGYTIGLIFSALSSDVVLLVLPILCALPYTSAFLDDLGSNFYRAYLPRSGKRKYIRARIMSTALSGGLALFLGAVLIAAVFGIAFLPSEVTKELPEMAVQGGMLPATEDGSAEVLMAEQSFVGVVVTAFAFFLNGALWSLAGAILCTVTMNKYVAYASPFVLYYVLVILAERYFQNLYVLNPREWVNPSFGWALGKWGAIIFLSELIVILAFLYGYAMNRRLRNA